VAALCVCPNAPGAPGNVSTRAVAARLAALGADTGIDLDRLAIAERLAREMRGGGA